MEMLSPHFSRKELACPCCGACEIDQALLDSLETLRAVAGGKPITIHSAYRCIKHNQDVNGAHGSTHMLGQAADISIPGMALWQIKMAAMLVPRFANGGIGAYPQDGHLHVDIRQKSARW